VIRFAGNETDAHWHAIQKSLGGISREIIADKKNQFVFSGAKLFAPE
jgi:hypothetical protein